jgi:hypothetical protein
MRGAPQADPCEFDGAVEVAAPPERVCAAFFTSDDLRAWCGAHASVTVARPLGIYALDWGRLDSIDPLLGPLGGAFYGVVIDVRPDRAFFLADAYWLPPEGDPIGPMALHVTYEPSPVGTRVRLQQSGCDDSPRWRRFYRVITAHWTDALARLKTRLDAG